MPITNARRYAQALLATLKTDEDLDAAASDLAAVRALLAGLPAMERLLAGPGVPASRKRALLEEALGRLGAGPAAAALLAILVEDRRLRLLPEVAAWFERLKDRRQGVTPVEITTPAPVREAERPRWAAALGAAAGGRVRIEFRTDPALIGGAVARVGSVLYDGSVRGSLDRIRRSLLGE